MAAQISCPHCYSMSIIRKGARKNIHQQIQLYHCKQCNKTFSTQLIKKIKYPVKVILNAISFYNLGCTQKQAAIEIAKSHHVKVPQTTISEWIRQFKDICTYNKLRSEAIKQYNQKNIIFSQTFQHIQPYTFKYHKAKLDTLIKENPNFAALKDYIEKINSNKFPHHIFTCNKDNNSNNQRASQLKFNHLKIKTIWPKNNQANQLTKLALNLAKSNKQRHESIQNFFLINDSITIATEMPTYLTNWDAAYYKNKKGFVFPLNNYKTPITGHIDILQIKNGLLHILDYKPDAHLKQIQEQAVQQLTIYAMALSKKLNLPLYYFKAAWFNENSYYEFFPLHAVYEKR